MYVHIFIPHSEGLANRPYVTQRQMLSRRVIYTSMKSGAVLIKAPPQSGKTSLLQLVVEQRDWLQGLDEFKNFEIDICFVSMLACETLDEALALKRPGITWQDLLSESLMSSMAGGIDNTIIS